MYDVLNVLCVPQDWELTSGRAASDDGEEGSSVVAHPAIPAALPSAQEVLDVIASHSSSKIGVPDAAILRGVDAAAAAAADANSTAAAPTPDLAADVPASVTTSVINEVFEMGYRPDLQQPQQAKQQTSEGLAHAKFWDRQIAEGKLSMLPEITIMHVNIMAWGESGLGKTVSVCRFLSLAMHVQAAQPGRCVGQ